MNKVYSGTKRVRWQIQLTSLRLISLSPATKTYSILNNIDLLYSFDLEPTAVTIALWFP